MLGEKIAVLVAAGGAGWEVEALQVLAAPGAGAVLLKRCVDVPDLLATAATGQARVAVVAARLDGIDADAVDRLHRAGVGVVAVTPEGRDDGPPDVEQVVEASAVSELAEAVVAAAEQVRRTGEPGSGRAVPGEGGRGHRSTPTGAGTAAGDHDDAPAGTDEPRDARIVAVWGPTGAPGRTTVAVGVAAELAARGHDTLLVDADPFGGAVAQHLGVLDEVSGLLSAVRLANTGRLDVPRLAAAARTVAPHLRVLTGLPRADRWVEVRSAAFDSLLEACRRVGDHVVLDLGFDLEGDGPGLGSDAPQRNQMTLAGLDSADDVLVVGAADPVGLSRLARGLVELRDRVPWASTHVVVNRMRSTVGWGQHEVRAMVEQLVTVSSTRFLPCDLAAADRALALGCPLTELGDSALRSGLADVVDALVEEPETGRATRRRVRRRRAGRAR